MCHEISDHARMFEDAPVPLYTINNNCDSNSFVRSQTGGSSHMDKESSDEAENDEDYTRFKLLCIPVKNQRFRTRYKRLQAQCYNFLERPCGVVSLSYHFTVFALVVAGLVLAVLETMEEYENDENFQFGIFVLEMFLLVLFGLEYMLRMWSAGCRSTYVGFFGHVRFAFKPFVIIDLVVIGSTMIVILKTTLSPGTKMSSAVSVMRFFQVLRMIRFDRQGGSWKLLGSVLFLHKQELLTTFYIGFCSLIFAAFFVYQAEKDVNKSEFGTFADSFWWGVVTLTTVGYGDKIPISWAGRGAAAFFAIMGISFFALPAGILGSGFALKVSQQQRQKHVKRRRRPAATLIQCNWRYYASRKESKSEATWLPYIRYIQERKGVDLKETNGQPEKPFQNSVRTRKLSIFGRKISGVSSDAASSRLDLMASPDHSKMRRKKSNELFLSFDSLTEGPSFSTMDQRNEDESLLKASRKADENENLRASMIDIRGIALLTNNSGKLSLPPAYKRGIRFTRYLQFLVALRKFKLAKKPYDVKDVIEQYSTGHVELLGKVKGISNKIDVAFGYKVGTEKIDDIPNKSRTNIVYRLSKLEKQVKSLDSKIDQVISLMEDSRTNGSTIRKYSDEGVQTCCVCGHSSTNHGHSQATDELKMPTRRRKVAIADPGGVSVCEQPAMNRQSSKLPKSVSLLTAERLKQAMEENKSHKTLSRSMSLKPEHMKSVREERNGQDDSDSAGDQVIDSKNRLTTRPLSCGTYDNVRRCSDSAIYSNYSAMKKDGGEHSVGVTPNSSDSEDTSVSDAVSVLGLLKHLDGNVDYDSSTIISPYSTESDVHETKM